MRVFLPQDAEDLGADFGRAVALPSGLAMDVGRAPDQRPTPELAGRSGVVATPHLDGLTLENADAEARSSVEPFRAILDRTMPARSVKPEHSSRLRARWTT